MNKYEKKDYLYWNGFKHSMFEEKFGHLDELTYEIETCEESYLTNEFISIIVSYTQDNKEKRIGRYCYTNEGMKPIYEAAEELISQFLQKEEIEE